MFWIFLWLCLSVFVIGAFVWTTRILYQQKSGWRAYAKKHNLAFENGPFFGSPAMAGMMGDYRIAVFSEEQLSSDARGRRFVSVIELTGAAGGLPARFAMGSGTMVPIIQQAEMKFDYIPESKDWLPQWIVRADDKTVIREFLTPDRLRALHNILKSKSGSAIFICDTEDCLLRYDTGDPLQDVARLEKIVGMMIDISGTLKVREGEIRKKKTVRKLVEVEIEEDEIEGDAPEGQTKALDATPSVSDEPQS